MPVEEQDGLRHRRSPVQDAGFLHVEEARRGPTAGGQVTLTLFGVLPGLFTVLAAHCKGKGPQTLFSDFLAALEAVAVCALLQARERVVHPAEGLRLHLDKSELDVFLDIGFRTLTRIENLGKLRVLAGGSDVAHLALHLGLEFPTTAQKHLLELVIPAATGRCGWGVLS